MSWVAADPGLAALDGPSRSILDALAPIDVPEDAVLFSPGESVKGYVIVLSGRIGVHLVGPNGRDILLYQVAPGQACIQSTLGLLGGDDYTGEAVAEKPTRLVLMPRETFLGLIDRSPGFRRLVFHAFAARMQNMMKLIENVSFLRVEARLAMLILDHADATGRLEMTQADMAAAIGSAREVVSRRLDKLVRAGMLGQERGAVTIADRAALSRLATGPAV